MRRIVGWLRPKSSEGQVFRLKEVEQTEPFVYGFLLLFALACTPTLFTDEWRLGILFIGAPVVMALMFRFAFARPHVVLGADQLVLVGVFFTRRVPYHRVRRAVVEHRSLVLVLTDREQILAPGHWGLRRTLLEVLSGNDVDVENAELARQINHRARAARPE